MGEPNRRQAGVQEVIFGEGVTLVEPVNLYGCQLGDGVFVGPFVEIQRHVLIGTGCRIQSHSFICEYVTLGEGCFIGHGVMFANDLFRDGRPNPDPVSWGRIRLGDRVVVGSNATILAVTICDEAVIGAGSVVTRDIEQKGIYAGNPARLVRPLP